MILIVNSGSSSIKFKMYENKNEHLNILVEGIAERINVDGILKIKFNNQIYEYKDKLNDHLSAVDSILTKFEELNIIENIDNIKGIGFRIVHGGEKIIKPCIITKEVIEIIKRNIKLAPLHNPGALAAITAFKQTVPKAKLIGCFDTSFHTTMPKHNFLYAIPYEYYEKLGARKYGFHGISYDYITSKVAKILDRNENNLNLIICHLGNGASIACVKNGKSYDTSMGLTPLAGLVMGTRCGDIDSSIIDFLIKNTEQTLDDVFNVLNKKSGLLGISGISSDMRDICQAKNEGNERAILAFNIYAQKIADYIVKYANLLEGEIDAIIFTAGIGENAADVRKAVIDYIKIMKLDMDDNLNNKNYYDYLKINNDDSEYKIFKIRTDEELMICQEVQKFITNE
ncbi:acetate kinase [Spiroplasma endosymbiont of Labia minor]|uniref:acetate kinase n=1 Tax=Spiroplasma endosymbiont of Labia minor TaxID=3066305 RepID=UPI0030CCD34D